MLTMLANHLWQSTLFVIVAGLLTLVLRKNSAQLRYWLWMTASLKFLVPFSLLIAFGAQLDWQPAVEPSAGPLTQMNWSDVAAVVAQPAGDPAAGGVISSKLTASAATFQLETILLALWLGGFLAVIGFWTVRWLQVRAMLRQAQPLQLPSDAIDFPAPVKSVAQQTEPGIVGVIQPVLLLPQGLLERLSRAQLRAILAHERCHLERRDNLTASIHMLIEAVFWFHPLVWWIGSRLVEERERACDAAVLRAGNDPETYAAGILDVCQHYVSTPMPCVSGVSGAELKQRVRAIMAHKGEVRLQFAKGALLASVAIAMLASPVLVGALLTSRVDAQTNDLADSDSSSWPQIATLSIAKSQSDVVSNRSLTINPQGVFATRNWSLRGIIAFAYNLQDGEIIERSASTTDLASARYTIVAKSANPLGTGTEMERQYRLMVRRLLAEHFQLQFHFESQRVPVYALTHNPNNAGLVQAEADDPGPALRRGVNSMQGFAAPMLQLKQYVSHQVERPLLDQTGLTERYNFKLKWGPEGDENGAPATSSELREPNTEAMIAALEQQLGLSLVSQDGEVRRLVIDNLRQPTILKPPPAEVAVDVGQFDRHVGSYSFSVHRNLTIYREGDRLFAQLPGTSPLRLYAQGADAYFSKDAEVTFKFNRDANGATTEAVLTQGAEIIRAARIDETTAKRRQDALAKRIKERIPQPGTERALWDYLRSLAADEPIYERMTKAVASAVRTEWVTAKPRFDQLGELKSIKHTQVGPAGADVYLATFERGASEWRVSLTDEGLIEILTYRRMPAAP